MEKRRIPAEKEDIDYAIARWVKSKLHLAEFLENEGKREGAGKHREEAETICRSRLGINKEKIPDNPEFYIIALYQAGWNPEAIAESFNIEPELVEKVIQQRT